MIRAHLPVAVALALAVGGCVTATGAPPAMPAPPPDQQAFVAAAVAGQRPPAERSALAGIEARIAARDRAVCDAKPTPAMSDWVGTLRGKDAGSSAGQYRLLIEIGPGVSVSTVLPTEHDPRTGGPQTAERRRAEEALARVIAPITPGRTVVFSGELLTGQPRRGEQRRCFYASNLLIRHRLDAPTYSMMLHTITLH